MYVCMYACMYVCMYYVYKSLKIFVYKIYSDMKYIECGRVTHIIKTV